MFKRFIDNEEGNFAVIMALTLVPMMGLLGAGFDYSQMTNQKANIQAAADTALLAAARDAQSSTEFYRLAENYFSSNYLGEEAETYAKAGPKSVSLTVSTIYKPAVMGILGFSEIEIEVYSEVAVDKFGRGSVDKIGTDLGSAEQSYLDDLAKAEKAMLQQVGNLKPRNQEAARKRIKWKFEMLRKQISGGGTTSAIHLSK